MENKKEIRVAVLGMGFIGRVHTYAYKNLPFFYEDLPFSVNLACVYNRTPETARKAQTDYGFGCAAESLDAVFERDDIDAVSICLPNFQHKECVLRAMDKGWHIYCEKPLAADDAEAREIAAALQGYGGVHRIVFHNRFYACVLRAKTLINEGRLGRVMSFSAAYMHPSNVDKDKKFNWKFSKSFSCGGVLFDMGSHALDMIYYLLGEYQGLYAKMHTAHPYRLDKNGASCRVEVEDAAYITAEMKNGAVGTVCATKLATGSNDEFAVMICGEKGSLRFNLMDPNWLEFYDNTLPEDCKGFTKIETVQHYPAPGGVFPSPKLPGGWLRAHVHSLYCFLDGVYRGAPMHPDLADGAYIQYVMEKAYQSDCEGRWLAL